MTTLTPPELHCYQPGEAVFYIPSAMRRKEPFAGIPAVVLRATTYNARIVKITGQKSVISPRALVYRGYCAACERPAHDRNGDLICPQCGELAIPVPPPDHLVIRWYPLGTISQPMMVHRAIINPTLTWSQAWEAGCRAARAISDTVPAAMQRLGLPVISSNYNGDFYQWRRETPIYSRMTFYAAVGDDAAFLAAYRELEAEQAKAASGRRLLDALRLLVEDDDPDATGLRVAPKWQPPADDQEPDQADEITAWLATQMRRAA
jgi:hypothetical protein